VISCLAYRREEAGGESHQAAIDAAIIEASIETLAASAPCGILNASRAVNCSCLNHHLDVPPIVGEGLP
jgi:hypothetical protein